MDNSPYSHQENSVLFFLVSFKAPMVISSGLPLTPGVNIMPNNLTTMKALWIPRHIGHLLR